MNFDYRYTPSEEGKRLREEMERASNELMKAYANRLNEWLGAQVEKFCPMADAAMMANDAVNATRWLNEGDFHYRSLPDGVTEFCQGDTVLARAKFEVKFTVNKSTQENLRTQG